eukprot:scaffold5318_cov142-Skeletonema_marinoi.AAC.5
MLLSCGVAVEAIDRGNGCGKLLRHCKLIVEAARPRLTYNRIQVHRDCLRNNSAPLLEESRYSEFKYSPQASSPMELDCLPRAVHYHLYNIYNTIQNDSQNLPKVT